MKLGKFELDKIYCGDCEKLMQYIPSNKVDLIGTDPPYGIAFMGKKWDTFEPKGAYQHKKGFKQLPRHSTNAMMEFFVPVWKECLRILKPGGFAFIMCSSRQDVLMTQIQALSEAGFNTGFTSIYWTYASGFPKAGNISKMVDKRECRKQLTKKLGKKPTKKEFEIAWKEFAPIKEIRKNGTSPTGFEPKRGWHEHSMKQVYEIKERVSPQAQKLEGSYAGFQPKPAVEIIIVAMKPLSEKTYIDQALENRKGITWLDDCKMPYKSEKDLKSGTKLRNNKVPQTIYGGGKGIPPKPCRSDIKGRFPANLLVSDDVLNDGKIRKDGGIGGRGKHSRGNGYGFKPTGEVDKKKPKGQGSYSRYFDLDAWAVSKGVKDTFPFLIVPKASKSEKNRGLEEFKKTRIKGRDKGQDIRNVPYKTRPTPIKNIHPTVKPIKLMSYLIILGSREGDIIFDPFIGSGTTAIACKILNRRYLGFETNKEYIEIANARIKAEK